MYDDKIKLSKVWVIGTSSHVNEIEEVFTSKPRAMIRAREMSGEENLKYNVYKALIHVVNK